MPSAYMHVIVHAFSTNKFTMTKMLSYTTRRGGVRLTGTMLVTGRHPKREPGYGLSRPNTIAVAMGYSLVCSLYITVALQYIT